MPRRTMYGGAISQQDVMILTSSILADSTQKGTPSFERTKFEEWMLLSNPGVSIQNYYNEGMEATAVYVEQYLQQNEIGPAVVTALTTCTNINKCNQYGKDDIQNELDRRQIKYSVRDNKLDLARILVSANKQAEKQFKLTQKRTQSGKKFTRGALPSESTNPHMYDVSTGLLRPKYLTMDHHGLTAYDFAKKKYQVEWNPINHTASWVLANDESGIGLSYITGFYTTSPKTGLPNIKELNYSEHAGRVFRNKDGELMQVHCVVSKGKDQKNMLKANCQKDKDFKGGIKLKWGKYSKDYYNFNATHEAQDEKKIVTPMGVLTYKQLMKLSTDEMFKMLLVLEMMDTSTQAATTQKMINAGASIYANTPQEFDSAGQSLKIGTKKRKSWLTEKERAEEKIEYARAGLNHCGVWPNAPYMCDSTSAIPGECVADEEQCYDPKYRPAYENQWSSARNKGGRFQTFFNESRSYDPLITSKDIRKAMNLPPIDPNANIPTPSANMRPPIL